MDESTALRLAASLEQGSSHPLARAILDKAADQRLPAVENFRTLRGLGSAAKPKAAVCCSATRRCLMSTRLQRLK